jgi:hypothetical protein
LAAGVVGLLLLDRRHSDAKVRDGILVAVGVFLVLTAVSDLREGRAVFIYSAIERSREPWRFWSAITATGGLGGVIVILAAASLLGLWKG